MIFDFMTITGADDEVDLLFLDDMTTQFPHVEWGILLSEKRKGSPRYPSDKWLARLTDTFYTKFDTAFSAHLCGSMCDRLIIEGGETYISGELVEHAIPKLFSRLQLNSYPEMSDRTASVNSLASSVTELGIEIILPVPNDTVLENSRRTFLNNVAFLYDSSRGKGIVPAEWPTPDRDRYVGYAGGFTPDNIQEFLERARNAPTNQHFWIDLESGARTDDNLDYKKVEKILSISEGYVGV